MPETQYTFEQPYECDISNWHERVPSLRNEFADWLKARGLVAQTAPECPPLVNGLKGLVLGPFRVLYAWIPDWALSPNAGKFVIRLDTMASKIEPT